MRPDPNGAPRARPLGRRAAVAQPRAFIGALLILLAAIGTYVAVTSANKAPTQTYVVALRDMPVGYRLQEGDIEIRTGELPDDVTKTVYTKAASLDNALVLAPVSKNGLIYDTSVRPVGSKDTALPRKFRLPVDSTQATSAQIKPFDTIDIVAVRTGATNAQPEALIVGRQIRVLAIEADGGTGGGGKAILTLALDNDDQECTLAQVMHTDKISIVQVTGVDMSASRPVAPSGCAGFKTAAGASAAPGPDLAAVSPPTTAQLAYPAPTAAPPAPTPTPAPTTPAPPTTPAAPAPTAKR